MKAVIDRLMAGEVLFLPDATWRDIKSRAGPIYAEVRRFHRYFHSVQHVEDGVHGLRVWVDDQPGKTGSPGSGLFGGARTL